MSAYTTHGLPFLPGNTFRNTAKSAFHKAQTLSYKNGYALPLRPKVGIGQQPLISETLLHNEMNQLINQTSGMSLSTSTQTPPTNFIPDYVAYDKKVLRFYGYFKQEVLDSPDECWRVRPVLIYYHLEDDSMCVMEPEVENSGLPQGKLLKRQLLPKNERGQHYHWKDLNLAMDLCAYGSTFRITHCDAFTQEFMESQGLVLNEPESTPSDPYTTRRAQPERCYVTPSDCDHLKQFITMDRKGNSPDGTGKDLPYTVVTNVLRFFALWDDSDSVYGEKRIVTIHYYLVDGSVEIREVQEPNSGRDPFPVLLHRQRIPKDIKPTCKPFPTCILEFSPQDVQEFYCPKDFCVGEELKLMGKHFLLCDCDEFTRKYYEQHHPDILLKPLPMEKKTQRESSRVIPPYNGFGSLEDSLQNCFSLIPRPPKKDLLKLLENDHKVLRYAAKLNSQNPQDEGRRFVLHYYLSDDMISIFEMPRRNSGIIGGKFLEKTRVPKPGCTPENPEYYNPGDFAIGATVEVFRRRFILMEADQYVLDYLESVSEQERIPEQTLSSLRQALGQNAVNPEQPEPLPTDGGIASSS